MANFWKKPLIKPTRKYGSDAEFLSEEQISIPGQQEDIARKREDIKRKRIEEVRRVFYKLKKLTSETRVPILTEIVNPVIIRPLEPFVPPERGFYEDPTTGPDPDSKEGGGEESTREDEERDEVVEDISGDQEDRERSQEPSPSDKIELFPKRTIPNVIVSGPRSKIEAHNNTYVNTLDDIVSDATLRLNNITGKFFNEVMPALELVGEEVFYKIMNKKYSGKTKDVPTDFKHLSDLIVRNEKMRDQKMRLLKKTHSVDRTAFRLLNTQASNAFENRYHAADKQYEIDFLSLRSDQYLERTLNESYRKCDESSYHLYKYLNSAVISIDECLKHLAEEVQAKAILHSKGVSVYDEKEEERPRRRRQREPIQESWQNNHSAPAGTNNTNTASPIEYNIPSGGSANIKVVNHSFNGSLTNRSATNRIIFHHAAHLLNGPSTNCTAAQIHEWHQKRKSNSGRNWSGIGYHYIIQKNGLIETGRPDETLGAHVQGHNHDSIGICFAGHLSFEPPSQAQITSAILLVRDLFNKYGTLEITGHGNVVETECPGNLVDLDVIRRGV